MTGEVWAAGEAYDRYVGRWSRKVAVEFIRWLDVPAGRRWLDVGCGTGALTSTALALADPASVIGVDPAEPFLAVARAAIDDPRATFHVGDAREIPVDDDAVDVVISGLALNFVPDAAKAAAEFARVAAPDATVSAYVWDYAGGMAMMRVFWEAAGTLDPAARQLAEGNRFPLCAPGPLRTLWTEAGLVEVAVEPIDIPTVFADFDDYWTPFLGGTGPAPNYVMSLPEPARQELRDRLRATLPAAADGSIPLSARAWAVRGINP